MPSFSAGKLHFGVRETGPSPGASRLCCPGPQVQLCPPPPAPALLTPSPRPSCRAPSPGLCHSEPPTHTGSRPPHSHTVHSGWGSPCSPAAPSSRMPPGQPHSLGLEPLEVRRPAAVGGLPGRYEGQAKTKIGGGDTVPTKAGQAVWAGQACLKLSRPHGGPLASAHLLAAVPRPSLPGASAPHGASSHVADPHTPEPQPHGSFQKCAGVVGECQVPSKRAFRVRG